MLPIVIGLTLATALGVARAAYRARLRLKAMPTTEFASFANRYKVDFLPGGFAAKMTYNEALQILDLPPNPSKKQLLEHHRRMMLVNHPDSGGSTYMSQKINEARQVIQSQMPR